jgi:hypothetical protein
MDWQLFVTHFSEPRAKALLSLANSNEALAIALSEWDIALGSAWWESLALFEVAIRNAIDRGMTNRMKRFGNESDWLSDAWNEFGRSNTSARHSQPYAEIERARVRLQNKGAAVSHERVLSELSFGFWHQLLSKRFTSFLPDLISQFPNLPSRNPQPLRDAMTELRDFRNRIGHHHQILTHDIGAKFGKLLEAAGFIDNQLQNYIASKSRLKLLLEQDPRRMSTSR